LTARSRWIYRGSVLGGYVAVRLAWAATPVRFRADTIERLAQFLDPPLLQERLLESLWYLHAQPPLLNLVAGLALKVAPTDPAPLLATLFAACGLVSCGCLAGTLRRLGLAPPAAVAAALLFVAVPPFAIYGNWFFYPHLAQTLLLVGAWCLARSEGVPGRWTAAALWALAGLVALRSLYHPLYLLLAAGAAIALAPAGARRRALALAAGPAAFVVLLSVKNLWLFGFFGTGSWGGNSLHRMMTESIDRAVLETMVRDGELSPLSLEWEFSPPERYLEILRPPDGDRGIPALDATVKTRAVMNPVNYNHWVYPIASREYAAAALRIARTHPGVYFRSLRWTARRYFDPVMDDGFVRAIRVRVKKLADPWDAFERSALHRALLAIGLAGALVGVCRASRRERLVLAFVAGTILWTSAVGIGFEFGENNRFRHQVTGLWWIAILWTAAAVARRLRRRVAGDAP